MKLEQIKFTATVAPVPQSDSDSMEDLKAEGVYKKGAGLSATATSTIATNLIATTRHSRWVLDTSGNVYSNLQLIDSKVVKSDPSITQEIIDKMALAMKTNTNKNKDVWVKMTTKDVEYDNVYGVRSCMLGTFYKMQSQPDSIQEFAQHAVQSGYVTVKRSGDVYQVVSNTERHDALGGLYTNSKLYKSIVECDKIEYAATKQQVKDMLKKLTIEIKVDNTNKIVSSIAFKVEGGSSLTIALIPTSGVTITIPKVTQPVAANPSETREQYMQRTSPYLYKNLMQMQESMKQ